MCIGPVYLTNILVGFSMFEDEIDDYHYRRILDDSEYWRRKKWLPIARDRFGNTYVLPLGSEYKSVRPVLFIDNEVDSTKPAFAVASHLFYFLYFLLGEETGERFWPFEESIVCRIDPDLALLDDALLPWKTA